MEGPLGAGIAAGGWVAAAGLRTASGAAVPGAVGCCIVDAAPRDPAVNVARMSRCVRFNFTMDSFVGKAHGTDLETPGTDPGIVMNLFR